jgi:hypothetical protein
MPHFVEEEKVTNTLVCSLHVMRPACLVLNEED